MNKYLQTLVSIQPRTSLPKFVTKKCIFEATNAGSGGPPAASVGGGWTGPCGTQNPASAKFCTGCGTAKPAPASTAVGAKFCGQCGAVATGSKFSELLF